MKKWTELLRDEDLALVRALVLASGSLKAVARQYGISYPTVRLRLDRVIEKMRLADEGTDLSDFERVLRLRHVEGRIDRQTFVELLEAHRRERAASGPPA
jgi:hypothetical protein